MFHWGFFGAKLLGSQQKRPLIYMDVSENSGFSPQIIHLLIGFSIIFTIHFGVPLFLETPNIQCIVYLLFVYMMMIQVGASRLAKSGVSKNTLFQQQARRIIIAMGVLLFWTSVRQKDSCMAGAL